MIREKIEIISRLGLHVRAIEEINYTLNQMNCKGYITKRERISTNEVLKLLREKIVKGDEILMEVEGEKERECIDMIKCVIKEKEI